MHMSYWFGSTVGDFLFKGFTIISPSGREQYIYKCQCSLCSAVVFTCKKQFVCSLSQKLPEEWWYDSQEGMALQLEVCCRLTTLTIKTVL
jgi:hypothetical protein